MGLSTFAPKMRRTRLLRALLVAWLGLLGCGWGMVLEWKDTFQTEVIDATSGPEPKLTISGLAGHSAYTVDDIEVATTGTTIDVRVHLMLANVHRALVRAGLARDLPPRAGSSGGFSYDLPIPATVNEVRFGNRRTLVWKRGQ
jgi:hypothetical protein